MNWFLIFPAFMLLAMIVRLVGWMLWLGDWITREPGSVSVSLFEAIRIGVAQGWALAWPIFYPAAWAIGAAMLTCAAVLCVPVGVAWLRRWRPPTVFLSYQNARAPLAAQLSALMEAQGIAVRFLPFDHDVEHGELNKRVALALDNSQYMVCLPGDDVSYLDSEVFVASHRRKPIIFVVDHPDGHLPNTGSKIYPVLKSQVLQASGFRPLIDLLRYLHGGWRETLKLYAMPNEPVGWVRTFAGIASVLAIACAALLFLALWFGVLTVFALEFFYSQSFKVTGMVVLAGGMTITFGLMFLVVALQILVNGMSGVIRRQRAVWAARNALREGCLTDDGLRAAFASAPDDASTRPAFLDALWPEPPRAVHEPAH